MTTTTAAVLVPLLPFLGAAAGLLLGRRAPGFVRPLAVLPTLAAAGLAVLVAVRQGGGAGGGTAPLTAATRLADTGSVPIDLALQVDGFAALVAVLVAVVACCADLLDRLSAGQSRYPSYAALVSLFAAMLLVVYADDLIVLLIGWEIMGICSYFLVGHYWETTAARSASLKAFLVTKLGDVPFLIGIFGFAGDTGTFRISEIHTRLTSETAEVAGPPHPDRAAAAGRGRGQVRAVPAAHLAAGRDRRPHTGLRADPRGHHGRRRCLCRGPAAARLRLLRRRARRTGRHGGRDDGRLGARRARPGRHQTRPRLLDRRSNSAI
ncbi:NAD(P)H-quinone oxidoreductase subunit 2, chloroplastic [Streptomyces antimycoticus]